MIKIAAWNFSAIVIMVSLIPLIENDYMLGIAYLALIGVFFWIHYEKHEWQILVAGAIFMFCSELIFISTGVETFNRVSLVDKMPIWLPILWGYGFVAIKRFAVLLK